MIGMMGGFGGYSWMGLILNFVITIAVIVGLVFLVIWLVRRVNSGGQFSAMLQNPTVTTALPKDILQARYARGEITRDQYMQMLADINQ